MKKIIYLLLITDIFCCYSYSQEKDSLIQLYPGLGDTVDLFDRNYFELFQDIDGFEKVVFYIRNNDQLVSEVSFLSENTLNDTTLIRPISELIIIRDRIGLLELQSNKRMNWPEEFIILTEDGNEYEADLLMFSKDFLYFESDNNYIANSYSDFKFKLPISNVNKLTISENNVPGSLAWGAGVGLAIGLISTAAISGEQSNVVSSGDVAAVSLGAFVLVGSLIGLIIGLASSSDDEIIYLNFREDVYNLKNMLNITSDMMRLKKINMLKLINRATIYQSRY